MAQAEATIARNSARFRATEFRLETLVARNSVQFPKYLIASFFATIAQLRAMK